jgi:DHA2 family methylenomycin A resistance protein-like MFS transporter
LVPNSLALLNHAYLEAKERGRAVGWWLAVGAVALTAGLPVGGALIALVGWRSIFFINLPIGIAGLWLTWRYVTDTPRASRQLDLPGQVAAIGALGTLAAALIEGGRIGWSDPRVIAAGVLNSVRQTGSALGVALFGSLIEVLANFRYLGFSARTCAVLPTDRDSGRDQQQGRYD